MTQGRVQAWLTSVTDDDTVTSALVLAESLRRTRTNKRIGVITCKTLSREGRLTLRKMFDAVFLIDDELVPIRNELSHKTSSKSLDSGLIGILRAKIFAFSLKIFDKCIFLEANTLVLENIDDWFHNPEYLKDDLGSAMDLQQPYIFQPSMPVCEYLAMKLEQETSLGENGNGSLWTCVNDWKVNNQACSQPLMPICQLQRAAIKFSVEEGCMIVEGNICCHPKMVLLLDVPKTDLNLVARLKQLRHLSSLVITEKMIVETWLKYFEESIAGITVLNWENAGIEYKYENEPIAIVGMSCRFPGANNLEEFWNLLYSGKEGIEEPPSFRWTKEHSIFGGSGNERKTNAGFLSVPVDEFDAKFFGVSPKEAMFLDPQTRLLHEVLWESLECSGIDPLSLRGSNTGIFTGSWMNDYKDIVQTSQERDFFRTYMGNSIGASSARLSFLLGLTGPNIATESGCSSAIVAVDMAVKSLRNGESNLALAGGVNLLLHPFQGDIIDYVIAPDGRCKTFDEKADGFGRAEGCGVLVLKRLSDAFRDRDNILAMIRGSAISQEGISRSLGTPTVHCEALAMELALKDAGVMPEQVSFVETHGTGTAVGDPMEVAAIAKAYHTSARKEPLIIGSVKTNVGHTESCSGITGIIKTVLAMQHQLIPKHLNLDTLNPGVNLEAIPAKIPMEAIPWPKIDENVRLAGVSSFGITGTDGHVILEEAPNYQLPKYNLGLERPLHLLKISAKSKDALNDLLRHYEDTFKTTPVQDFASVAYTANIGRASFSHRAFILAKDNVEAGNKLETGKFEREEISDSNIGKICFLFTGQGSQYPGMAKSLYDSSPVFQIHFDACDRILRENYNLNIRNVLWNCDEASVQQIGRTIFSQTSIFCVEYCLLKLWNSWGINPDVVMGHSLGEFCAAVAAGILTFEDALKLVVERSLLIDSVPGGSMLVIKASLQEVDKLMQSASIDLDIAAVNSLEQTVVAGDTEQVMRLSDVCKKHKVKAVVLEATHAFHSRHMDSILEKYKLMAQTLQSSGKSTPTCIYISGMEGKILENPSSEINPDYWVRHTRERVSFLDACKALKQLNCQHFLEIGPQPVLSTFVMQNVEDVPVSCFPSLRRNTSEWETILTSLGKLYLQGFKVDWGGFDKPYIRKKVPSSLPFHPFHRKSFWVDCSETSMAPLHPLIGSPFKNASVITIFQSNLNLKSVPYLRDHCIGNRIILPGAAFLEMCLSAGHCTANGITDVLEYPKRPVKVENFTIHTPLELKEGQHCRLQIMVDLHENHSEINDDQGHNRQNGFRVKVFQQNNLNNESSGKWVLHASSSFTLVSNTRDLLAKWNPDRVKGLLEQDPFSTIAFYKRIDGVGLKFGQHFQSLKRYWVSEQDDKRDEIVAEMNVPKDFENYLLHPIIIDAMLQARILSLWQTQSEVLSVPVRIGKMVWLNSIAKDATILYFHAKWENKEDCLIFVLNEDLTPVAVMMGVELIETNVKTIESILQQQNSPIPDCWEEIWKPIPGPNDNQIVFTDLQPVLYNDEFTKRLENIEKQITPEDKELAQKINRLVYLYALKALLELGWKPFSGERIIIKEFCQKHKILPQFLQLVRYYFTMFQEEGEIVDGFENAKGENDCWIMKDIAPDRILQITKEAEALCAELGGDENTRIAVNVYKIVGNQLAEILLGETTALSTLFPSESSTASGKPQFSAEMYYQHHPGRALIASKAVEITSAIMSQLRSINCSPSKVCRILEVGAGTGSLSLGALKTLSEVWGTQFEYYYTDISQSFFAKAEKKLQDCRGTLKFCTFNIEKSPLEQGIPINYFDAVMASDVLHTTKNLRQCLRNLRQTLRPQGTLIFTDTLTQDRGVTFVFGLLDGYWRFEDFDVRPHHTCVDGDTWRKLLLECEFNFVHVTEAYMGVLGVITAQATGECGNSLKQLPTVENGTRQKWIVFAPEEETDNQNITHAIRKSGFEVKTILPSPEVYESDERASAVIQSVLGPEEVDGIVYAWGLSCKNEQRDQIRIALPFLHIVKHILNQKKPPKLYVLTRSVHAITDSNAECNPSAATLFGMVKSLKNESSDLLVRYVDLDHETDVGIMTDQILFEFAMYKEMKERERVQVAYRDGIRYEPKFNRATQNFMRDNLQLPPSSERYQLVLPDSRLINDLQFDILEQGSVGDMEIEVATKVFALNFRDIFAILKPTKQFEEMNGVGLDFSGVVTKVGEKVASDFKVGQRVFGVNFNDDQLPSHLVLEADKVLKIPDKMTFAEASTLPTAFATTLYCLMNVAKMKKGDTVLIHTGSGGVGLSAIQLAKQVGANIITTAGSPRKRAYLKSLGIEHVFHSRNTSYEQEIMKVTHGRGVDIVLNSLTGPGFKEATLNVCAQNARFVEMSKLSVWTEEQVRERRPDVKYSIEYIKDIEPAMLKEITELINRYLNDGFVESIPFVQFDALQIRQAFQYFQKAKHIGKVVVTMPEVRTREGQWSVSAPLFNDHSTYLITGGLGGIGFEVCKWMLKKGATDIVLIGRNPPKPEIAKTINQLNKRYNIVVKLGDVGNYDQCKAIIDGISESGGNKPIRGVQHCAGVIRDNIYAKQTWQAFEATFRPKVDGTWNLHNMTSDMKLEHFVLYSSMAALVGTPSQATHVAANCFEDAFAHYRYSLGLPATSINWGQWSQVGVAKEINLSGIFPVSVKRMLNGLEAAFRNQCVQTSFGEFESFHNWSMVCPMFKHYLDERLSKGTKHADGKSSQFLFKSDQFWKEIDEMETREEKTNLVIAYMKEILRGALRMEVGEEINEDANMQELGVDSLMLIELKNSIQSLMGSRLTVTANMMKDCSTIRDLATVLVNKICDNEEAPNILPLSSEEYQKLLETDCVLDESINPTNETCGSVSTIKTVLITGVSGQLGPYILSTLCQSTYQPLENIICLIRTREGKCPREKLQEILKVMNLSENVDMSKVECVRGDVALANFGLSEEDYTNLCKSVDGVIHLAAKSNHVEMYRECEKGTRDIRSVNVGGTLNVLRFASTGKTKHVFYSSGLVSVFGGNDEDTLCDDWPEEKQITIIADNAIVGYPASKFVCEMLLKQANDRDIPCKVFRFPWIMGESKTGQLNYLNNHYILRFLSYLKIKSMPDAPLPALVLPVDVCADVSMKIFWNDDAPNEIYNISHPSPELELEFIRVANEDFGIEMEAVDWKSKDFIEKLYASDMPLESLKELYTDVDRGISLSTSGAVQAIQGYLKSPENFFRNNKVDKFVPDFSKHVSSAMSIISKDLAFVKSKGFFDKFGI